MALASLSARRASSVSWLACTQRSKVVISPLHVRFATFDSASRQDKSIPLDDHMTTGDGLEADFVHPRLQPLSLKPNPMSAQLVVGLDVEVDVETFLVTLTVEPFQGDGVDFDRLGGTAFGHPDEDGHGLAHQVGPSL